MKFGFVTCVQLGLSCMEAIYEAGYELSLVVTLPDDKAVHKSGRVYLDGFCTKNRIPLLKSNHVNDEDVVKSIRTHDIDWLFIIGWSQIAGDGVIAAPKKGVLGMHPSLLPIGRGRASIPWAILKDLKETGVTLFKLDSGVDTGSIAAQVAIEINQSTNATSLYDQVNKAHVDLIKMAMPKLAKDGLELVSQDNASATYWPGRKPEDGMIDLSGSVWDAERLVRAVTKPYPGAFFIRDGKKYIVWGAWVQKDRPSNDCLYLEFVDGYLVANEFEISEI